VSASVAEHSAPVASADHEVMGHTDMDTHHALNSAAALRARVTKAVLTKFPGAKIITLTVRKDGGWTVVLVLRDHRWGTVTVDRHLHVGPFMPFHHKTGQPYQAPQPAYQAPQAQTYQAPQAQTYQAPQPSAAYQAPQPAYQAPQNTQGLPGPVPPHW
jgi:hypothetical protein